MSDMPGMGSRLKLLLRDAHPFLWALVVVSLPATAASVAAEKRAPGYAVNSEWVYRLEVGLAMFVGLYLLVVAFWLAYHGRSFRRVEVPGGPAVEAPEPGLTQAAEGFEDFRDAVDERLEDHDDSLVDLDDRVADLEALPRFRDRLRRVFFGR